MSLLAAYSVEVKSDKACFSLADDGCEREQSTHCIREVNTLAKAQAGESGPIVADVHGKCGCKGTNRGQWAHCAKCSKCFGK